MGAYTGHFASAHQNRPRLECNPATFVPVVTKRASWESAGMRADGEADQIGLLRSIHVF